MLEHVGEHSVHSVCISISHTLIFCLINWRFVLQPFWNDYSDGPLET